MTQHKNEILALLADGKPRSGAEIGSWVGITIQRAVALCRILVEEGKLKMGTKKVWGRGEVKIFSLSN